MNLLDSLPHRPPMRLVDAITDLVPGERATGTKRALPTDFYFDGHFPGEPVIPAVVLVEMLAQVGGLAAGTSGDRREPVPVRLRVAGLGPFKFPGAAGPGAELLIRARVAGRLGGLSKIEGEVIADGRVVASGSVTFADLGSPDADPR